MKACGAGGNLILRDVPGTSCGEPEPAPRAAWQWGQAPRYSRPCWESREAGKGRIGRYSSIRSIEES